jgi:hypothetical protein
MKRIYIAGPMTGLPEFNYPAFNAEAQRLRGLGGGEPCRKPSSAMQIMAGLHAHGFAPTG